MGNGIDIINILLLVVAGVVFWRLRSVLGRRTGEERQPFDPYSAPDAEGDDKVVQLPGTRQHQEVDNNEVSDQDRVTQFAPKGSAAAQGLTEISLADRRFDTEAFLAGSKVAYEMIVTAFAAGDRDTLGPLLSDTVYQSFDGAISGREQQNLTVDMSFVGLKSADIREAILKDSLARITVRFVSEITSSTRQEDGVVVEGDPVTVREVKDIWTFERDIKSRDPNWRVVQTETEA